jgi:hypothetical protein
MPDLSFHVEAAEAVQHAASPLLSLKVRLVNAAAGEVIRSVALRCQVRIEPPRRPYSEREKDALADLFGDPARWEQTLRPLLWAHVNVNVPPFVDQALVELPIACTFDLRIAAAKYFHALEDGDAPLLLLFSGTVFHDDAHGALRVAPVPWSGEARFRLPARVYKETMDHYYPNSAGLILRRDVFDRLDRYRAQNALATWDDAISRLLSEQGAAEV